jgi:ligand-binding sensor domain-containing protein/AraC-like DNA-binding protein
MWIGTESGLDRFDGRRVVNYAKRLTTPLRGAVQSIAEIRDGLLLLGTSWGAGLYDLGSNRLNPVEFNRSVVDVRQVFKTSAGLVYLATDNGLYRLDLPSARAVPVPSERMGEQAVTCLTEVGNGRLLGACADGLYEWSGNGQRKSVLELKNIRTIARVGSVLYLGTQHGLYVWDSSGTLLKKVEGLHDFSILALASNGPNTLVVGTDNEGMYEVSSSSLSATPLRMAKDNVVSSVFSLYFDRDGLLWTGTFDSGIYFLPLRTNKRFSCLSFDGSANANIRSFWMDPDGEIFVGTRYGKLLHLDGNLRVKAAWGGRNQPAFRSDILTTIAPYPGNTNRLLIGTFGGGVRIFDRKSRTFSDFSELRTFQWGTVYRFCSDGKRYLWMATLDGLYEFDGKESTFRSYSTMALMGSNELFSLDWDGGDKLWLGTKTGLCYFSLSGRRFGQPVACKDKTFQCTSVRVDAKGRVWACFNRGGVLRLDRNQGLDLWLDKEVGTPENAPSSLAEDNQGRMWIGSSKGLFRISESGQVQSFGLEDDLDGVGFCPESAFKDAKGRLWWSNEHGLVTCLDDRHWTNGQPPRLVLTELALNGNRYDTDTASTTTRVDSLHYRLVWSGRSLTLELGFAALNFHNPEQNHYAFLLKGVDAHWSRPGTDATVSYKGLGPGRHRLWVKASNSEGIWTSKPLLIEILVMPRFYQTYGFYIVLLLLTLGAVFFGFRSYMARLRNRIVVQLGARKSRASGSTGTKKPSEKDGEIRLKLISLMEKDRPWLQPDLRQAEVANALDCTVHELSQVLNGSMEQNFSDFVNSYRVEEVKRRIQQGDHQRFTLTALAEQSGFSAKSSFQRAFKKATDLTPTEYLRLQGRKDTPSTNKPS